MSKETSADDDGSPLKFFMMRVDDIEVRTCDNRLCTNVGKHVTAEIVKLQNDGRSCYTIASWKRCKEGFDLWFVGNRPFDACDGDTFWRVAKAGQEHLDKYFCATDNV